MSHMVFRHGNAKKWKGVGYDFLIVSTDELQSRLDEGWLDHPDQLLEAEKETDAEVKTKKKPGPKPKAATDESNN